jgi:restriction system protein
VARRGFFAELAHQQRLAEQERLAGARLVAQRANAEARAAKAQERLAATQAQHQARMAALEASRRSFDARQALIAKIEAENAARTKQFKEIDSILATALDAPPFRVADLSTPAEHPPFDPGGLDRPTPKPKLQAAPPKPVYKAPPAPQGLSKLFGKKQHLEAEEAAKAKWREEHVAWTKATEETIPAHNRKLMEAHEAAEKERLDRLAAARAEYDEQCAAREERARDDAKRVEEFAALVANNDADSVQEFVNVILENSWYPEGFEGSFDATYDAESREATVNQYVPEPGHLPKVKAERLIASSGDLRETLCSQTEQRTRYNNAMAAVALRVLHELFSAEPSGVIETVSLVVGTETIDPATGQNKLFRFVAVAAARDDLLQLNLRQADPTQALAHLGAVVSKNAFALKPISDERGVRK